MPAAASFGQTPPEKAPDVATEMRNGFNEVNDWVTKAAEMVPAEKYNYRPVDTVRTFGQLIAHITDSYNFFCARGVGNKVEYSDAVEQAEAALASAIEARRAETENTGSVEDESAVAKRDAHD